MTQSVDDRARARSDARDAPHSANARAIGALAAARARTTTTSRADGDRPSSRARR